MAARSKLWLPWDTGSNTISVPTAIRIDQKYLTEVGSVFKGTILAVKGWFSVRQDAPSNAMELFLCGIGVFDKDASSAAGIPDLDLEISSKWLWYNAVPLGGPGGDSTALTNVMAPYTFLIDSRSKRTKGYQEEIVFSGDSPDNTSLTFRAAGRMLLLEA